MKRLSTNISGKNPCSYFFVKFAVFFLFLGLAYRLFSSSYIQFSPVVVTETEFSPKKTLPPLITQPPAAADLLSPNVENKTSAIERCDIFVGDWISDPGGPPYTNDTCHFIEGHQNCMKNGRPDSSYIYWRWKPRDCAIPKFDSHKFLDLMRNKTFAFIGDSIMRNHVQSLLCTLSQAEEAIEVYHDEQYRSKRWYFPSHQFTLSVIWSPFLTKATIFEDDNGVSSGIIQLHLDELDTVWTDQFNSFDYVLTAGGKWFLKSAIYYENKTIVGCHNCPGKNITELGFDYAYRKALNSTLKFITGSEHKVNTFLRTTTPDHFENGEWNTGGYCNRSEPFKEGETDINVVDRILRDVELEEFKMASSLESRKGLVLKLFDTTKLSLMRPDGHPGAYRFFHPFEGKDRNAQVQNDCLHWCLPGPIDSWNALMMQMLTTGKPDG